ncbi:MAG: hypothetical protein GY908_06470, partial [Flavobacteriales bacterium]|nr:hypothetical protein [Flavobacteriales bacterium]
ALEKYEQDKTFTFTCDVFENAIQSLLKINIEDEKNRIFIKSVLNGFDNHIGYLFKPELYGVFSARPQLKKDCIDLLKRIEESELHE